MAKLRSVTGGVTLAVLKLIGKGYYAKQIATKLNKSKVTIHRHINKLKIDNYITENARDFIKTYELTDKGKIAIRKNELFTLWSGAKIKLHAMQGSLRIVSDNLPDNFWDSANTELRNWIPKYKKLPKPIGLTVTKTPSKIVFHVYSREINDPMEGKNIGWRAALFLSEFFKGKGMLLDIWSASITNQHYSIPDKIARRITDQGLFIEVDLGRECKRILTADKSKKAKAWIDASDNRPEIETNDIQFATRYIRMPEMVAQMLELQKTQNEQMAIYAKHLNAHIPVLEGMQELLKNLNGKSKEEKKGIFKYIG